MSASSQEVPGAKAAASESDSERTADAGVDDAEDVADAEVEDEDADAEDAADGEVEDEEDEDADAEDAAQDTDAEDAAADEGDDAVENDDASAAAEGSPSDGPLTEIEVLAAERDAYLEDLQRVSAEFTNFRRQTLKRNTELIAQAASRLVKALLPVLDACEAAVSQGVEGIDAVQAQLLGVLSGEGLSVVGAADEPFDPSLHEAVLREAADDGGDGTPVVAEVLRTGYALNGRVLRPAMVKVRG